MVTPTLRIGLAIVLAMFFCVLAVYNVYLVRMTAKAGGKTRGATIAIRVLNAVLILAALGLVIWAMVRK